MVKVDFENPLELSDFVVAKMRSYAIEKWPEECCGIIAESRFFPQQNISPKPGVSFVMSDEVWVEYGDSIQAVVHSHCSPVCGIEPSQPDMELQVPTAMPWGILLASKEHASKPLWWGDFRLSQPLEDRPFIHGVLDCYSLVRAWYWQNKQQLVPDVPRENRWWTRQEVDLYEENYHQVGFHDIDKEDVDVGDMVIFRLHGKYSHHAGLYIGNGLMIHHLQRERSCIEPFSRWQKFATRFTRFGAPS